MTPIIILYCGCRIAFREFSFFVLPSLIIMVRMQLINFSQFSIYAHLLASFSSRSLLSSSRFSLRLCIAQFCLAVYVYFYNIVIVTYIIGATSLVIWFWFYGSCFLDIEVGRALMLFSKVDSCMVLSALGVLEDRPTPYLFVKPWPSSIITVFSTFVFNLLLIGTCGEGGCMDESGDSTYTNI